MLRNFLYDLLENNAVSNRKKFFFDIFLAVVIVVSIIFIFLENEKGGFSGYLGVLDTVITIFFILEFIARFYICSNFSQDKKEKGVWYAIKQKIKWFFKFNTLIDFLAILPAIKFLRIFRTLRFLRLFRLFKVFRLINSFKEVDRILTIVKGMKEESRIFLIFFGFTSIFILIISFALYIAESKHPDSQLNTFRDAIWYAIKIIGFGNDTPKTSIGRIFASILLLTNMAIFGFFISIIVNKIRNIMSSVTSGKMGRVKLKNHIVMCGYTKSSQDVIKALLKDKSNINNIVLVTKKQLTVDISGVIYVNGDYTDVKTILSLNIKEAKYAIVFAEPKEHDTNKDVDLRTIITIFHIEKEAPHVHTIAEINEDENADIIIEKINGDEILYKESIDSQIISSCISHKYISNMFYEILGASEKGRIAETNLKEIKLANSTPAKQVKFYFVEQDATFLGYIDQENKSHLSPKNDTILLEDYRLFYLTN